MSATEEILHPRLTVGEGEKLPEHEDFTEEKKADRNFRKDKPFIPTSLYFNGEATLDAIRHFVNGVGDTNPLFCDPEYAKATKYGGIIAPPTFLYSVYWVPLGSGAAGVHGWYSGGDWQCYRPIYKDDTFSVVIVFRDFEEKKGRMAGGRSIYINYTDVMYINQRNELVAKELQHTVWAPRADSGEAGKYRETKAPVYSKDNWRNILEQYENEELRGNEQRYWEDVEVGEELQSMIKGPLTVRDMIAWLMGVGSPFFRAHKIEYDFEKRHPKALEYVEETGEADVPELVHIFDAFARTIGVERAYDYGHQRMTWLGNYLTNWMGDDAFLWKMSGDLRVFNQVGDITTFNGKVIKKYIDDGKCCVDIEAWAKNQRDENSMPPNVSTVVLPSKEHGPVKYPEPEPSLAQDVARARPLREMIAEGII